MADGRWRNRATFDDGVYVAATLLFAKCVLFLVNAEWDEIGNDADGGTKCRMLSA